MYRRIILNRLNNCTPLLKPIDQNMKEKVTVLFETG